MSDLKKIICEDWGNFKEFGNLYLVEGVQRGKNL